MNFKWIYILPLIAIITLSFLSVYSQEDVSKLEYLFNEKIIAHKKQLLEERFGKKKRFLKSIELSSLAAISHYPELSETTIRFKRTALHYSMNARPTFWSIFKHSANRTYIIRVNNRLTQESGLIADSLDFNAQVGLLGHEFAHISDYQTKNSFQLLRDLFGYAFSKKYKIKFERETDQRTLEHGLVCQSIAFSEFIEDTTMVSKKYKKRLSKYYLNLKEKIDFLHINK